MSTDLVRFDDEQINGMTRYAKAYSGSEFFKDKGSIEKAFVAISAGAEIGVQPFAAITGISIIQGKPVIGAGILAGLVKSHPKYDYRVKQLDDDACVIVFLQDGESIGESSFTMADAKRAGLAGKDVWKNYPRNMLFARAISNGVAFYTPDVTTTRMYVEHELDDIEPAPRRKREAPTATMTAPPNVETVIDVDPVDAAPAQASTAEDNHHDPAESEQAASTTIPQQTEACKLVVKAMSKKQLDVVKECVEHLGIAWDASTPFRLVERFGSDATDRDSLLRVLAAAVTPPEAIEGEVSFGEDEGVKRFETFLEDDTAKNIAAAEKAQDEAAARIKGRERMAAAGSYGES